MKLVMSRNPIVLKDLGMLELKIKEEERKGKRRIKEFGT